MAATAIANVETVQAQNHTKKYKYQEHFGTIENGNDKVYAKAHEYQFPQNVARQVIYSLIPDSYWSKNGYARINIKRSDGGILYVKRTYMTPQEQQQQQLHGPAAGLFSGFMRAPEQYNSLLQQKGGKHRRTKRRHNKKRHTKRRR